MYVSIARCLAALSLWMIAVNGQIKADLYSLCRTIPGDASWPSLADWASLNDTVDGRLVATIPIAAPCHNFFSDSTNISTYNQAECAALRDAWFYPETHLPSSSSPMAYSFSNNSCNPWLEQNTSCTIGSHVLYTVNVTDISDLQEGLDFVKRHNIRLVIRNTGHDYLGKSTGAHSLALWTHNMKSLELIEYNSADYKGPAIKIGAGVLATDAYNFAHSHGLVVVGGNCPTVGIAGGYTQGGGHGPLASLHGLGADQVLEWDVIIANGTLVKANATQNNDLFWALRGGGGGTYGIVVNMTVKAFPDTYASSAYLTALDNGTNTDTIYKSIKTFLTTLPSLVDAGIFALWVVSPSGFSLMPAFAPGLHKNDLDKLLQPVIDDMNQLGLNYTYSSTENDTFLSTYDALPTKWNVSDYNSGGRLIPRDLVTNNTDALLKAIREIGTENILTGVSFNVKNGVSSPDEVAVNPYFREALFDVFLAIPINYTNWDENIRGEDEMTHQLLPLLEALTPNGGAYLNEADFQQPNFQSVFYGDHYDRLLQIKRQYDPDDIFYAKTAVGSEFWKEQVDGRLCHSKDT